MNEERHCRRVIRVTLLTIYTSITYRSKYENTTNQAVIFAYRCTTPGDKDLAAYRQL